MKLIAIDPGYDRVGIAIIEKDGKNRETLLYSDCFCTDKTQTITERIFSAGQEVERLIKQFAPEMMALEKLFFANNKTTAMGVSEARGAFLYIASQYNLKIVEYTPVEIKVAVASYGKATKEDVHNMVAKLITLPIKKRLDDEVDAIALGLTALAHKGF